MSGQSNASSLYSGIFNIAKSDEATPIGSGLRGLPNTDTSNTSNPQSHPAEIIDHQKSSSDKSQAWSAALRFTPRKNVALSKSKRGPIQSQLSAAFSNTDIHSDLATNKEGSSSNQAPLDVIADPGTSSLQSNLESVKPASQPKPLFGIQTHALTVGPDDYERIPLPIVTQPPSLSLSVEEIEKDRDLFRSRAIKRGDINSYDHTEHVEEDGWNEEEDVNGFANTAEGKKAKRKKRKRRSSPGHHGGLTALSNLDGDYDPRIPNDFIEFRKLLAKRREAERVHRKRLEAAEREDQEFDKDRKYDDQFQKKEDGRMTWNQFDRSDKFAPPIAYSRHSEREQRELDKADDDDEKPYLSPPPTLPPSPPSRPPHLEPSSVVTGEDAYQKRLAMSQATSGEEAYQRRLAMSQGSGSVKEYSHQPRVNQSDDLASRTAAAAAIAARLIKMAPPQEDDKISTSLNTKDQEDPSTFAERLMEKQGWKKGEAIGAEGNKGILNPLLAQKVEQERARQNNKSQRGDGRITNSTRGTIINPQEEQKRQEERQKYGEASEVILLENMVANDDDIDDDLSGEIGEECEKYGKVERVFIWPASHSKITFSKSFSDLKPRIFVKFNGISSAWKCLKELDGRFFAGNTVRARYYPVQDFNRGNYDRLYD